MYILILLASYPCYAPNDNFSFLKKLYLLYSNSKLLVKLSHILIILDHRPDILFFKNIIIFIYQQNITYMRVKSKKHMPITHGLSFLYTVELMRGIHRRLVHASRKCM